MWAMGNQLCCILVWLHFSNLIAAEMFYPSSHHNFKQEIKCYCKHRSWESRVNKYL